MQEKKNPPKNLERERERERENHFFVRENYANIEEIVTNL